MANEINTTVCSPWTTVDAVRDCGCNCDEASDEQVEEAIAIASDILFRLSGAQFPGSCQEVVRPCSQSCWGQYLEGTATFVNPFAHSDGFPYSYNLGRWGWDRQCGCGLISEITLGVPNLYSVQAVYIDGSLLPASAYQIQDNNYLVRVDGEVWPACQDLSGDYLTDENTFAVIFRYGLEPPPSGVRAATVFAKELVRSCLGLSCALPERVTTITRQGVTMALADPMTYLDNGKIGLYEVDLFLGAVNPNKLQRSAQIFSPDIRRPVRHVDIDPAS